MRRMLIAAVGLESINAYAIADDLKGDWVWVHQTQWSAGADDYLFDASSAVRTGNRVAYWEKDVSYSAKLGTLTSYGHVLGDCSTQRQAEDASTVESGQFVTQRTPEWKTYLPNDPRTKVLLAVCRKVR